MKKPIIVLATLIVGITGLSYAGDAAEGKSTYPLTTCVVSGEALDSMGDPYVFNADGQEVRLCCKECKKKFDEDPQEFVRKLNGSDAGDAVAGGS